MSETGTGRGADRFYNLEITLEEAFSGVNSQVRLQEQEVIQLIVPPGVDTGTRLRLQGMGEPGRSGGRRGDLYVNIHVREHPVFTRTDYDLACEFALTVEQLATGGTFQASAPVGTVPLVVPPGTSAGTVFTLPWGMPFLVGKGRGTLRVTVVPTTEASATGAPLWTQTESQGPGLGSKSAPALIALAAALLVLLIYLGTRS